MTNGDLVVSSRTPDGVLHLFGVHTGILAQHSPVFADMINLSGSTAGRETYDGAPLVHFPDDAKDVAELFQVSHNPG